MKKNTIHAANAHPLPVDASRIVARDIMQTGVLVLRADDSIHSAAEQLEEIHATGAPVVDGAGHLIGVLTTTDIARSEHVETQGVVTRMATESAPDVDQSLVTDADEVVFSTEAFGDEVLGRARVGDWMTPGVTRVAPDTTLAGLCRMMMDEDIHRVFVVEHQRLLGVVSTKDVVRLLAASAPKGALGEVSSASGVPHAVCTAKASQRRRTRGSGP
jgi:CBS domain-containing protein